MLARGFSGRRMLLGLVKQGLAILTYAMVQPDRKTLEIGKEEVLAARGDIRQLRHGLALRVQVPGVVAADQLGGALLALDRNSAADRIYWRLSLRRCSP
jgi:hypothetical protein